MVGDELSMSLPIGVGDALLTMVGKALGGSVWIEGIPLGAAEGTVEGDILGKSLGIADGTSDGLKLGKSLGKADGLVVVVGLSVGLAEGPVVGAIVGLALRLSRNVGEGATGAPNSLGAALKSSTRPLTISSSVSFVLCVSTTE
jgi:hypothetical protein